MEALLRAVRSQATPSIALDLVHGLLRDHAAVADEDHELRADGEVLAQFLGTVGRKVALSAVLPSSRRPRGEGSRADRSPGRS